MKHMVSLEFKRSFYLDTTEDAFIENGDDFSGQFLYQ